EDMGYKIKVFKITKTSCYELYGHDQEGKRVEIYFNPTNMEKVKEEKDG
ncbi:PepSY domain-containing protein, partial [Vibrio cholerae]